MSRPTTDPTPAAPVLRVAAGWRDAQRDGYGRADLARDAGAGVVVGLIAVPLSMALAIAVGVPPQHGLFTAIVAGVIVAVLGGSRVQVSGPTAAFVVILAPIVAAHGLAGLAVATALAGVLQIAMAMGGLGRLIEFVPHPVTIGFTAGIATVIAGLQLKDFLGLAVDGGPAHFLPRMFELVTALPTLHPADALIGAGTLAVLILLPRWSTRVPAPLVALVGAAIAAALVEAMLPGVDVATIRDRFGSDAAPSGVPAGLPSFVLPWHLNGAGAGPALDWSIARELVLAAVAIALLGAIESLLSAVVADGMTGHQHDANGELLAQGAGNLVAPFFGGFAATGALARTAANVRYGARSPLAAIVHAAFVLLAVLALAPALGTLPMAALAALLLRVAWNMAEARHFVHALRASPRSDVLVQVACFGLTVALDMVVAVLVGVVLSALLFMRRMAEIADVRMFTERHDVIGADLPPGVLVYEIGGPLFFGAAQRAMGALRTVRSDVRVVLLDLRAVPVIDATGLVNLESAVDRLHGRGIATVLVGVQPQPARALARRPGLAALPRGETIEAALGTVSAPGSDSASSQATG